jgi:hypothetical protein
VVSPKYLKMKALKYLKPKVKDETPKRRGKNPTSQGINPRIAYSYKDFVLYNKQKTNKS